MILEPHRAPPEYSEGKGAPNQKTPARVGRGLRFRRRARAFPRRLVPGQGQATWLPRYPDAPGPGGTVAGQRRPLTGFAFCPCAPPAIGPLARRRGDPRPLFGLPAI